MDSQEIIIPSIQLICVAATELKDPILLGIMIHECSMDYEKTLVALLSVRCAVKCTLLLFSHWCIMISKRYNHILKRGDMAARKKC